MLIVNEQEYFLIMDLLKEHNLEICLSIDEIDKNPSESEKQLIKSKYELLYMVNDLQDKFIENIGSKSIQKSF